MRIRIAWVLSLAALSSLVSCARLDENIDGRNVKTASSVRTDSNGHPAELTSEFPAGRFTNLRLLDKIPGESNRPETLNGAWSFKGLDRGVE